MIRARKAVACMISMSILILAQFAWAEGQPIDPMAPVTEMNASDLDSTEVISEGNLKSISGSGEGELLISLSFSTAVPVASGSYYFDISGINLPPISTPVQAKTKSKEYDLKMPGILIPSEPNNIALIATPVENMNVAFMRLGPDAKRAWTSRQFQADRSYRVKAETDLIYPRGAYGLRIFGDAPFNATKVELTLTAEKRFVIDGPFDLAINTTGFPSGRYSLSAKAINGSFELDEIGIDWSNQHHK